MFYQKILRLKVVRPAVRILSIWMCSLWTFLEKIPSAKWHRPPICHNRNPCRKSPSLNHTKELKRTWGVLFFLLRFFPSFHTAHRVKLRPNSLSRNLKAILFPEKNGVTQTVMIWPDCTLTCPSEHRVSLVFKAAAEWPRFQTWAAWAPADGEEGTVRQAAASCFPAIHSNEMRCGAMIWQL